MKLKFLFMSVILFGFLACNNDDNSSTICDMTTLVSSERYENAASDPLTVKALEINGDCLKIRLSSGGCSGDTWELKLIDSGDILESMPPQRNLRLLLKNKEECLAIVTKEVTFDISNLKFDGSQVQLNITNSDEKILYKY